MCVCACVCVCVCMYVNAGKESSVWPGQILLPVSGGIETKDHPSFEHSSSAHAYGTRTRQGSRGEKGIQEENDQALHEPDRSWQGRDRRGRLAAG